MADTDTRLAVTIEANTKSMENSLKRLEGVMSKSMASQTRAVAGLDSQFRRMSATALKAAGALGIAFSARMLVNFVVNATKAGEAIGDAADKLGITAEAFQGLAYAADQSGTSIESVQASFKGMTNFLGGVERGSKEAAAELKNIGLSIADLKGKSPDQVFELLLDRIGKIQDPLRRNAELIKVFGKNGAEMAQLAQLGAKGIDALIDRARQLGIIISGETIKRAQQAGDALGDIAAAGQAAGINLAAQFLPVIESVRDIVTSKAFQDSLTFVANTLNAIAQLSVAVGGALIPSVAGANAQTLVIDGQRMTIDQARAKYGAGLAAKVGIGPGQSSAMPPIAPIITSPKIGSGNFGGGGGGDLASVADAERLKKAIEDINNQLEQSIALSKRWNDALMDVGGAAFDVFAGILDGTKDAKTAILDFIKQLALAEAKAAFLHLLNPSSPLGPIATLLGGQFPGLPGRASGGPVMAGMPYMVGENRRPELFIPNTSGRIMPNMGLGGGPPIINIINNGGGRVNQQQRTVGGRSIIDIVIDAVKGDMAQGGFDGAMQGRYGGRALTRRLGV